MHLILFGCREAGIVVKNVDITSGEVTLNLNEELLIRKKSSSDSSVVDSSFESSTSKKPEEKRAALLSLIPEKVGRFKFHGLVLFSPVFVIFYLASIFSYAYYISCFWHCSWFSLMQ